MDPSPKPERGLLRLALLAAGTLSMGLGVLGVFLPFLPTTPFVLLAAACFLRSSPRLHAALLADRRVGPFLQQWQREHSIPRAAKRRAYLVVCLTFALSITLARTWSLRLGLLALMGALLLFLRRLPVGSRNGDERREQPQRTEAEQPATSGRESKQGLDEGTEEDFAPDSRS